MRICATRSTADLEDPLKSARNFSRMVDDPFPHRVPDLSEEEPELPSADFPPVLGWVAAAVFGTIT